ncbi:MAG: MGMT family protein [Candidatus Woesearchaeota archaeon]|nr:MGMT family protein [Candidatus Woesearchaeota archaeon]MDP7181507.1 MGMT family protein [Candidatus Woesearchaeota archaeon]MDP7198549.1 MGMT family protein [Candidatus Woesearchaeota archaeon]MDP7466709.1 MGMT family protein [Candidatus Woesearchaeota archaeon]MDP7647188.1 MGMT family protein [Candidatus Woesearchaeota archaeon]
MHLLCKQIPKGKVSTYGSLAKKLKSGPRAVGQALNKNIDPKVPCHRVVMSDGSIGGFREGVQSKIKKLAAEGVHVSKGKVLASVIIPG